MPRRQPWEQVVLLPGRIVTLPLSALGRATERGLFFVEQHGFTGLHPTGVRRAPPPSGIRLRMASLGDKTGLGGRVEAYTTFLGGRLENQLTVAHSASLKHYHDTWVKLGREQYLEYDLQWRPQDRYYGLGMRTHEDSVTTYATQREHVRGVLRHRWNHREAGEPRTEIVGWIGPRGVTTRRGRDESRASIEARFADDIDATFDRRLEHLVYGMRLASDWRDGVPHWSRGWRALIETERYDAPVGWLALRSAVPAAQFTRTTVELEGGYSFGRDPRTLRLVGRVVDQAISAGAELMLIDDLSSLGGREGLRGFQPGRFHDLDLMHAKLTYVFPLVRRLEMDLHVESGAVFPDLRRSPRFDRLQQSWGFAVRGRTSGRPLGALGIDMSREAVRLRYSLGNPDR